MIVFLNGEFVAEEQARVSVFDRSFQYGDGLFETIRISNGQPFRWVQHLERLEQGADFLHIELPSHAGQLKDALTRLVRLNDAPEAVLRIALSRGTGRRGYSPKGAEHPIMVMSLQAADPLPASPTQWKLATSSLQLAEGDPTARWKTSSKLLHVLARREAEEQGADEALLLNTRGDMCEAASGNVFWIHGSTLHTPPVEAGLLPGVTRAVVLELASGLGLTAVESRGRTPTLIGADGAFVTMSSTGIVEIISLDGHSLQTSTHTRSAYNAYRALQTAETEGST